MKERFDCRLSGDELWVARDPEHHYLTKFRLRYGTWKLGHKRGRIIIEGGPFARLIMTMGYYDEDAVLKFRHKISKANYDQLMNMASSKVRP